MTLAVSDTRPASPETAGCRHFVTAAIAGQLFAIPVTRVQDVFAVERLTPVPLAAADVAGLMNLRGRVITAIDPRPRLGLSAEPLGPGAMAIGIEAGADSFGLLVERVAGVVEIGPDTRQEQPCTLDARWGALSRALHRVADELVIEANVDAMLGLEPFRTSPDAVRPGETP